MSFCKEQKKIGCFRNRPFGRGRRTLSPRSTLVGQDGSAVPKGTVFTAVLFSSSCKKRIKKSAAYATDLLAGAEGLFLLARRSSVRTALPCQRARYSLPSYSRPSARSKEKNRLLLQPTFLAGAEGLFLLARRSSVRTALPCQRARYSLPSYLVLLQEANKKIGCFCNRPFGRGRRTLSPRSTLVGQDGSTVPKGTVFTAVLFSSFCKKRIKKSAAFATDLLADPHFRNPNILPKRKNGYFSLDARRRLSCRFARPCVAGAPNAAADRAIQIILS